MRLYLAGAEQPTYARIIAGVGRRFALITYYELAKAGAQKIERLLKVFRDAKIHVILDSGLFSYLFGQEAGNAWTEADLEAYCTRYLQWVNEVSFEGALVECDAQLLLGLPAVEKIRRELFKPSGRDVIYVWHWPDGMQKLRDMANEHEYIAIGIPSLKRHIAALKIPHLPRVLVKRLVYEARRANPRVKIHLLGTSALNLVDPQHVFSCDSTSWLAGTKFGHRHRFSLGDVTVEKPEREADYLARVKRLVVEMEGTDRCSAFWRVVEAADAFTRLQAALDKHYGTT